MKYIFSILFSFSIITAANANENVDENTPTHNYPAAGIYDEGLIIAYDRESKLISGYYENVSGWNEQLNMPRFNCVFYLEGIAPENNPKNTQKNIQKNQQTTINIKTWFPGNPDPESVINGTLTLANVLAKKNININIQLEKEHGGCWNVQHFIEAPVEFSPANTKQWIGIRIAKSDKTYFYRRPDNSTRRHAYIINGDVLKVLKYKPNWLYAEYRNKDSGRITSGWIQKSDIFSARLPQVKTLPVIEELEKVNDVQQTQKHKH